MSFALNRFVRLLEPTRFSSYKSAMVWEREAWAFDFLPSCFRITFLVIILQCKDHIMIYNFEAYLIFFKRLNNDKRLMVI